LADTISSSFDLKIAYAFGDEDDPAQWITMPNPNLNTSEVKSKLANIESLAVDNKLLIGSRFKSEIKKMSQARIVSKTDTTLDWRS